VAVLKIFHRHPIVAQMLIVAILAGGLPPLCGVILQPGEPAFTLDICHAAPGADRSSATVSIATPLPARAPTQALAECGAVSDLRAPADSRPSEAPDPPPPKTLA
jgi:hypothetical protein